MHDSKACDFGGRNSICPISGPKCQRNSISAISTVREEKSQARITKLTVIARRVHLDGESGLTNIKVPIWVVTATNGHRLAPKGSLWGLVASGCVLCSGPLGRVFLVGPAVHDLASTYDWEVGGNPNRGYAFPSNGGRRVTWSRRSAGPTAALTDGPKGLFSSSLAL